MIILNRSLSWVVAYMSDIVFGGRSDIWSTNLGCASVGSLLQTSDLHLRRYSVGTPDIRPPPQTISYTEKTARIRVLVFLFFHFPSVVVRSSKFEVFGMATVRRGYNKLERRRVIKTLLDAGVESTRALSERLRLCKAPNETIKDWNEKVVKDSNWNQSDHDSTCKLI